MDSVSGKLSLEGVSFRYPGQDSTVPGAPPLARDSARCGSNVLIAFEDEWALRNVTFDVKPGEIVALVGAASLASAPV